MNQNPEDELAERLVELGDGWKVISATTTMVPYGKTDIDLPGQRWYDVALHRYYTTTVIVERVT